MCKKVHSSGLSKKQLYNAVKSLGDHSIHASYLTPGIYKSTLPHEAIFDIIKNWKLKYAGEEKYMLNIKESFAKNILAKEIKYTPNFDYESG